MSPGGVNPAIEDYVKVIYSFTEWQPRSITPSVLASRLGLSPSSVTEMVKKLAAQGLVAHEPYGAIELTAAGTRLALRMVRRHRIVETWLVRQMGYAWDEVHDEAEVLEHALSDRLLDALDAQLGHPARDPHGDPIPTADGRIQVPDAVVLSDAAPGTVGAVVRISDRDPHVLRVLDAAGIDLDSELRVVERTSLGATVEVAGRSVELTEAALAAIWVTLDLL